MNAESRPIIRFPNNWTANFPDPETGEFKGGYFKMAANETASANRNPESGDEDDNEAVYIVCEACGHHNWTPYLDGFRCASCGHLRGTTGVAAAPTAEGQKSPKTGDMGTENHAAVNGFALLPLAALAGAALVRRRRSR